MNAWARSGLAASDFLQPLGKVCLRKGLREHWTLFRHYISSRFPPREGSRLSLQMVCVVRRQRAGSAGGRHDCKIKLNTVFLMREIVSFILEVPMRNSSINYL